MKKPLPLVGSGRIRAGFIPNEVRNLRFLPKYLFGLRTGFTLLEILIVIGIATVLIGFGYLIGFDFYRSQILRSETQTVVSLLRVARSKAMANVNQAPHGFAFRNNTYVMFQGTSYASRDSAYDEITGISPLITATGTQEVVFSQLSGNANAATVMLSTPAASSTISINNEGRIDW